MSRLSGMTLKAVLTTILLGTSSIAAADPGYSSQHYGQHDAGLRARVRQPIILAQNVQLTGAQQRPAFVRLDGRNGIRKLRFDVDKGRAYVDSVLVMFADGHRQTIPVRQMLTRRNPSTTIQLPHAGVTGVYIYGASGRAAQARRGFGFGQTERGAIDVIGLRR